ncbi:MAG TPA: hypothetical protein DCG06_12150 [Deltaproteobacteria bacterium]|nr:hypothetical protein [Deltaproteobacteria bacterium]
MRWYKRPLLHFLAGGLLLFVAEQIWFADPVLPTRRDRGPIVIDVEQLRSDQAQGLGRALLPDEEIGLIRQEIDTELLYREALDRGLDVGDRAIRGWLIRKMRFVSDETELTDEELYQQALQLRLDQGDQVVRRSLVEKMRLLSGILVPPAEPTDEELISFMASREDLFREPARLSLEHIFLSRDRRPETLDEDARGLLTQVREDGGRGWESRGDPFPLGRDFKSRSRRQIASSFGTGFADEVFTLPAGTWSGPVDSAYGQHLVRISDLQASHMPELESVRNQLRHRLLSERRDASLDVMVEGLREASAGKIFVDFPDERGQVEADLVLRD